MTTVKEIETAIEQLPQKKLHTFRDWFEKFDASAWDQQLEADSREGRLDILVKEAKADYKAGKTSSL